MSRVLIGQSYFLRFDPKLWEAMQPYPPLGALTAAAVLREDGHQVAVFDAMLAHSDEAWDQRLAQERPDVAVLFEDNFNYLSKMCLLRMRAAALRMIASARKAGCTVIACGSDATDHEALYLHAGADHVVVGEGEMTLRELLRTPARSADSSLGTIVGLRSRTADGSIVDTGRRKNLRELDTLPIPAWDLIDIEPYREAWSRQGRLSLNIATTRGCPFRCNWCAKPIWGDRYASRSPGHVVDEIEWLQERYAPGHLNIVDDIFGLKPGWLAEFADEVAARNLVTPFKCLSRADLLLRDGDIEALRRAGCETVWIGAESGAQSVLDAMDKGTTVEQIVEAARRLRDAGIRVGFFLQFGYLGEGRSEIEATRRLVRVARPDDIGISVSYPLPGTRFYERVKAELGEQHNWTDSDDLAMLYDGPFSTDLYRRLHGVVHREFRLQKAGSRSPLVHGMRWLRAPRHLAHAARVRDAIVRPFSETALRAHLRREETLRPTNREANQ